MLDPALWGSRVPANDAWVAHDLGRIAQIARAMAKQCRDAVGPWRAYLSVLDR